jgi:UDP-glucuronate 4-epimerase
MVTALAEGRPFELYGDGTQSRSFTYVGDVVEATIAAMEDAAPGSLYNVGGGVEVSMLEAISALERVSGRRLEVVRGPRVEGDVRRTAADTSRIRSDLGWEPRTSFEQGLEAQWRWAADRVASR